MNTVNTKFTSFIHFQALFLENCTCCAERYLTRRCGTEVCWLTDEKQVL